MYHFSFVFSFFLLSALGLMAQEDNEFSDDSSSVKIFIAAGIDYGVVYNNKNSFQINFRGGFEYHNIYVGGFGESVINDIDVEEDTMYKNMQLDIGYGGFMLGYEFFPEKKITLLPCVQLGWGVLSLSEKNDIKNYMERIDYDNIFIVNTMLQTGYKLTNSFSINVDVSYRLMTGLNSLIGFSNNNFSGLNYGLVLRYHLK